MAEAVSPQSVIASPSRSADGAVVEQGATLVGDRDSLVEQAVRQLTTQAPGGDPATIRAQAEREVDALMGNAAPAPPPAPAPVIEPEPVPDLAATDPAAGDD
ncbi:hypothetical protein [Haloactinopolyspora sp.]|uniref:hypothetical protein n=1 Tax=Haloactinopolyspora sp. TaxID=1966353 RepID=UPI00260D46AF|nr:hypothetical protein [Haloactinopolyspora sp.]